MRSAFTLVEVIVTMGLGLLVLVGVMSVYVQNLKGLHVAEQRMKLASQVKKFTDELEVHSTRSNAFVLFKTAAPADFNGPNAADTSGNLDRQSISGALRPGGDFVVFVYYQIPKVTASEAYYRVTKLEGYFLTPDATTRIGAVRKVVIDLSAAPYLPTSAALAKSAVEDLLTAHWSTTFANHTTTGVVTTYSRLFSYGRGLLVPEHVDNAAVVAPGVARLFYMSNANNVIVSGQLYSAGERYSGITADWRTSTHSFNFTITPRT